MFKKNLTQLGEELVQRGYDKSVVSLAFVKVRQLDRQSTLEKVVKEGEGRITLVVPFDKRLGNVSNILRHRWDCLVARDQSVKSYMPLPPMVSYRRTSSLRDMLVRAKVPPKTARCRRQAAVGFRKCDQRVDCSVCPHSVNTTSHTCNSTAENFPISSKLSCLTPWVIYSVTCNKGSGQCARVKGPQYIGCSERPFKKRFSEHVGTATQPCHQDTVKPVGVHFRLPGHSHSDLVALPMERVRNKCRFVLEARERFWIQKYNTVKLLSVEEIESGLNLK